MRTAVVVAFLFALTGSANADRASEAREHYQTATAHFAVGEFSEAAAEYQAAYKLKQDPALLYDAAQAYRLANDPDKALILYKNYLQMYPNQPNAGEVRAQIEKLKEAIAASERAKTSPPTGTTEPKQLPERTPATGPAAHATAARAQPTKLAVTRPAPKRETPIYKKWWLWTIVGAVAVGGAVTAAVLATQSNGSWSNAPDVGPGSRNGLVQW